MVDMARRCGSETEVDGRGVGDGKSEGDELQRAQLQEDGCDGDTIDEIGRARRGESAREDDASWTRSICEHGISLPVCGSVCEQVDPLCDGLEWERWL